MNLGDGVASGFCSIMFPCLTPRHCKGQHPKKNVLSTPGILDRVLHDDLKALKSNLRRVHSVVPGFCSTKSRDIAEILQVRFAVSDWS